MAYEVPALPYDYNALEPTIDEATMKLHHDKHHQAYVDKANDALSGTEWDGKPVEEVLANLSSLPEDKQGPFRNNGGGDVRRQRFLVGHRQDQLGIAAIAKLEDLGDVIAPGLLPQVGRRDDRHEHLLAADAIHLLADDLHDVLVDPPAGRQPRPQPRAELADEAGPDHQLVRDRFRVGGRLTLGREEELR